MASLRRVRKDFRKEVLQLISTGDGNIETLISLADKQFGRSVGYHELLKTFLGSEVSNAVSFLRTEGHIESIGKKWKPVGELAEDDVNVIELRRKKRIRGELKASIVLAHNHGRTEEAITAAKMLELIAEPATNSEAEETASTSTRPPVGVIPRR